VSRLVRDADDPRLLAGWDDLANGAGTFYTSAAWLAYSDRGAAARSRYYVGEQDGRPVAALSAHWNPDDAEEYLAAAALGVAAGPTLTLGGRRAYRSAVLARDDGAAHLPDLVARAVADAPATDGRWWWPYLTSADAATVLDAARGAGVDCHPHLVSVEATLDVVPGDDLVGQVDALSTRQRRTNARRELRAFDESGLTVRVADLGAEHDALGPLLANVQRKYGHGADDAAMRGALRRQAESLGAHATTLVCEDEAGDPVGFALLYRWGDELALRVVGFDYERLRGASEYGQLTCWAVVRHARDRGVRRIHMGIDSYEAKARRGARLGPLWAVTNLGPQSPERRTAVLAGLGDLPRHESATLHADVRAAYSRLVTPGAEHTEDLEETA
jgi:hypothetical protein